MGIFGGKKVQGELVREIDSLDEAKSDDEIANWVKSKVEEIRSNASRMSHESVWMQNCAAVLGFNSLAYNATTRTFQAINRPGGIRKNSIHVNKLLPNLQNRLARLTQVSPKYDVRPNDSNQEAKDNARFKLDILNAKWEDLKLNQKRQQLVMWVQQCGHAYLGIFWDDSLGNIIDDPLSGEKAYEGDIRIEVISPFEVFPDPLARDMDDGRYWIRAKVRPLSYFYTHYGEQGKKVKEESTWLMSAQFESRINSMNTRGPATGNATGQQKNCAIELTYFERPSIFHPRGRMIVSANGIKLLDKELCAGKMPLVKFDDIMVAGKYYSEAVTTHARPIQDQYNQVIRRRADWVNRMLAGKYVSPRGNELAREALSDEQGEIVQYTVMPSAPGGGEPRPMQIPNIPQYAYTEEDKLDAQFAEIMGISEISKGILPSATIPGIGMQLLQEADATRMGTEIENHEHGFTQIGTLILDFVQEYYDLPRKIKYAGEQAYVVKEVSGKDLKGTNDVIVVRGSTVPTSKVLRRQDILNAYQQGLLGDPADPNVRAKVLRDIEFGDVAEIWVDASLDKHVSKREIETIEAGEMPEISEADNHAFLFQELNRYRKSDKFLALDPDRQEILKACMEQHLQLMGQISGAIPPELSPAQEQKAMEDGGSMAAEAPMPVIPPQAPPMPGEEGPAQSAPPPNAAPIPQLGLN